MHRLYETAHKWGVTLFRTDEPSYCYANRGEIYLQSNLLDEVELITFAHEMGHIYTEISCDAERKFPYLRLYRKDGKHRLRSKTYMKYLLAEELEAWAVAKRLLTDLKIDYDNILFEDLKKEALDTYEAKTKSYWS